MLKLSDLRKTTRRSTRSGDGDLRNVHPHLLRDRTLVPRIEMATRYMERHLGRPRREMDDEVVVQLFGDHKLARCIVACLAATYRYRPLTFAEVLHPEQVAGLAAHGLHTASELRLWLFRRVNNELSGFAGGVERAGLLRRAADTLGLGPDELERLLPLDAPDQAVLVRTGAVPNGNDVIARYNNAVVAALLANAPVVRIALAHMPGDAETLRAYCAAMDVQAELTRHELVLQGRQDVQESWVRHGSRLVRTLSFLLAAGLPARSGEAIVAAPGGAEWRFRLDSEVLGYLGATDTPVTTPAALLEAQRRADAFTADYSALRRAANDAGWSLRRASEPLVGSTGIVPALWTCTRGTQRVALVPIPSEAGAKTLSELATSHPLIVLDVLPEVGSMQPGIQLGHASQCPTLRYARRADLKALPDLLASVVGQSERSTAQTKFAETLTEARQAGVVAEAKLAERLGCAEEKVASLLLQDDLRRRWQDAGLHYVEGFGLCTDDVLRRARAATQGLDSLLTRQDGATRRMRVLGQRLREMTGAREGIECLIAYLGAA